MGTLQSLIYVVVMEDFYSTFLNKRKIPIGKYLLVWFSYFVYQETVMSGVHTPIGNLGFNFVYLCFILYFLYMGSVKMKVVSVFLGISLMILAELVVCIIVIILQGEIDTSNHLYGIISKIVFWGVVRITSSFIKGKMEEIKENKYLFPLGVIAGLNVVWVTMIFEIDLQIKNTIIHSWTLVLAVALLALDVIGFKVYSMLLERQEIQNTNEKYRYQLEMCNKEMEERQIIMNDVRRTKHDIKNQLLYLNELVKKDPQKAESYLEKLMNSNLNKENGISNSGNLIIDSLINHKFMIAAEKGIETKFQIKIPPELPYEAADLCIVVGNLLDNAIEAVQRVGISKWIDVSIQYRQQKLLITIKNVYCGKILQDRDGNYISQKNDSLNHGWGLKSVYKCVEKYNGTIEIHYEENVFRVDIMM